MGKNWTVSKPRTAEHRRLLGLAHIGTTATKRTRSKMSASHEKRLSNLPVGCCRMCGSRKHTFKQHQLKVSAARKKSKLWKAAVVAAGKKAHTGTVASLTTRKRMAKAQLVVQNSQEQLALRTTHGESSRNTTAEYAAWHSMKSRCSNPNTIGWNRYGGRGIKVCKRWLHSYENFLKDVGRKPTSAHSLDRYPDPDGNYEPGNVRWATGKQQRHNRGI